MTEITTGMAETLVALFAAHVIADYLLQTTDIAKNKHRFGPLVLHGLAVFTTAILMTGSAAWPVFLVTGLHILVDLIKANFPRSFRSHIADQTAHIATLAMVSYLFPRLWADGLWQDLPAWVSHLLLLTAGLIYATRAGGFAVADLMAEYDLEPERDTSAAENSGLANAGQTIGQLERALIYLLLLNGLAAGIGFLIAAKSILRFETGKDQSPEAFRKHSEYVIIGTLTSFTWAIAISLAVIMLHAQLPDLGIKPAKL